MIGAAHPQQQCSSAASIQANLVIDQPAPLLVRAPGRAVTAGRLPIPHKAPADGRRLGVGTLQAISRSIGSAASESGSPGSPPRLVVGELLRAQVAQVLVTQ